MKHTTSLTFLFIPALTVVLADYATTLIGLSNGAQEVGLGAAHLNSLGLSWLDAVAVSAVIRLIVVFALFFGAASRRQPLSENAKCLRLVAFGVFASFFIFTGYAVASNLIQLRLGGII